LQTLIALSLCFGLQFQNEKLVVFVASVKVECVIHSTADGPNVCAAAAPAGLVLIWLAPSIPISPEGETPPAEAALQTMIVCAEGSTNGYLCMIGWPIRFDDSHAE
jgi:hypothetical protein